MTDPKQLELSWAPPKAATSATDPAKTPAPTYAVRKVPKQNRWEVADADGNLVGSVWQPKDGGLATWYTRHASGPASGPAEAIERIKDALGKEGRP